jgi:BAG domain
MQVVVDPENKPCSILDSHLEKALELVADFDRCAAGTKVQYDTALKVGEALLQTILKIDGLICEDGWERFRAKRKQTIKEINTQLDRIDAAKASLKQKLKL